MNQQSIIAYIVRERTPISGGRLSHTMPMLAMVKHLGFLAKSTLDWTSDGKIPDTYQNELVCIASLAHQILKVSGFSDHKFLDVVRAERNRQFHKWGEQNHSPDKWLTILTEEVGELAEEIEKFEVSSESSRNLLDEAIQIAAVAVQMIEWFQQVTHGGNFRPTHR